MAIYTLPIIITSPGQLKRLGQGIVTGDVQERIEDGVYHLTHTNITLRKDDPTIIMDISGVDRMQFQFCNFDFTGMNGATGIYFCDRVRRYTRRHGLLKLAQELTTDSYKFIVMTDPVPLHVTTPVQYDSRDFSQHFNWMGTIPPAAPLHVPVVQTATHSQPPAWHSMTNDRISKFQRN